MLKLFYTYAIFPGNKKVATHCKKPDSISIRQAMSDKFENSQIEKQQSLFSSLSKTTDAQISQAMLAESNPFSLQANQPERKRCRDS
ncbi:MAG: hypothetical protein FWH55_12255 [Oscillospiraceae bacterium]|nr:hypothetical protein [Oscillospiraceae bacterium]